MHTNFVIPACGFQSIFDPLLLMVPHIGIVTPAFNSTVTSYFPTLLFFQFPLFHLFLRPNDIDCLIICISLFPCGGSSIVFPLPVPFYSSQLQETSHPHSHHALSPLPRRFPRLNVSLSTHTDRP
jgi:hypothetical protein